MATLLDDQLVADALQGLDGWSGDARRLSRTVRLTDADELIAAVREAADAMNHHPQVDRSGTGVTFVLWTHSQGGVTELDVALASRINDLIASTEGDKATGTPGTTTSQPHFPTPGETTPSRPSESATGDPSAETGGIGAPLMNEPADPRQDAGPIALPDASPGSIEPQPGNVAAPGMHEPVDSAD